MTNREPVKLNYARPSVPLRRWGWRALLLLWAAFTVYLLYDKWGISVRWQIQMHRAQSRAMSVSVPPDTVMYEADADRALALLAKPGYRRAHTA